MITAAKQHLKRWLCGRMGICYNPFGVPFPLAKHLQNSPPVSLIDVGAHEGGEFTRSLAGFVE